VVGSLRLAVVSLLLLTVFTAGSFAATKPEGVSITLAPSVDSPQFLGASINWTATVHSPFLGHKYDYQFAITFNNQYQIVRDFNDPNSFTWVPYNVEGTYRVSVTVRDITQQPYVTYPPRSVDYVILPWVTVPGGSAVHATSHPLVALFSGPPCQSGHTLLVRFQAVNSNMSSTTNSVPCSQNSANFYIAGMYPSTQYLMHWEEYGPDLINSGADLSFTTGPLPADFPKPDITINVPPTEHDYEYPVVFWEFFAIGGPNSYWPTATDLMGNVLWYLPGSNFVTRIESGGNLFTFPDDETFREYDQAGNVVLETNWNIMNEQLVKKGYPTINDFNIHETRRLPNGDIAILGSLDVVSTEYQGGTKQNPVDIIGEMILILDHNMQLVWAWNPFEHDNLAREATLHETCTHGQGGCPKFNPDFAIANDWIHANSIQYTDDGNLLLSERHQDYVLKVNYQNGQGDGTVIWRMGPYGDFTLLNPPNNTCGDPNVFPWFTHQHDAAFQNYAIKTQIGVKVFTVFDDGNLRNSQCGGNQNSRGILMLVNENAKTVSLVTEADLGAYSSALGSADFLPSSSGGLFSSYGNGFINFQAPIAQSTEVDLTGKIVYQAQGASGSYRTYRMQNLYTPTLP
jgi:arylsulfate sulfotransferase